MSSWWHYIHGEPPMYILSVEGLGLETVVAEMQRLLEERRTNMKAFWETL